MLILTNCDRPEGRPLWCPAECHDDELIEPEVVERWCRGLALDETQIVIECTDGKLVSVRPPVPGSDAPPAPN